MDEQTNQPPTCHPTGKWVVASNGAAFCSICGREPNQPMKVPTQVPVTDATVSQTETPMLQLQPEKVLNAETVQATEAPAAQTGGAEQSSASRDPLLVARQATHGNFADNARISQYLKRYFRTEKGHFGLPDVQQEAIDMICLKLSRIMSGQADYADHWNDIAGYAKLAAEVCTK